MLFRSGIDLTVAAGVLKNPSKYDFLVEKVTEIGARRVIPLLTERTIPSHAKVDRWRKLALAAMKQSGRSYLPHVHELTRLDEMITGNDSFDLKVIAHERAETAERSTLTRMKSVRSILILIGPEGGFSDGEVEMCMAAQFQLLHLGDRRLRTETAAIVAATLALCQDALHLP